MVPARAIGHALALLALAALPAGCADDGTGPRPEPRVVEVEAGAYTTCARLEGGEVYCWGLSSGATFGDPANGIPRLHGAASGAVELALTEGHWWGTECWLAPAGEPWCLGTYSTGYEFYAYYGPGPVELQDSLPLHGLVLGEGHGCGLDPDGEAICWGSRMFGKRGGEVPSIGEPWGDLELSRAAPGLSFVQLSAGQHFTCGLTPGGEVYCWGQLEYLGDSSGTVMADVPACFDEPCSFEPVLVGGISQALDIESSTWQTCAIVATGQLRCWAAVENPDWTPALPATRQPTTVSLPVTPAEIHVSAVHACALDSQGSAWCWGERGPWLGNPAITAGVLPVQFAGELTQLDLGTDHSCGVTDDGELWCWGKNDHGQLGDGTTEDSAAPVRVRFR